MMKDKLSSVLKHTTSRYIIIGVSVYIIELGVIFLALHLGSGDTWAVALSFWIGLMISFILQKFVTFRDTRTHHKILLPQIMAVSCLVLFNFTFTIIVTKLLRNHTPIVVSRTLALGITTLWNLYLYKSRIFKTDKLTLID